MPAREEENEEGEKEEANLGSSSEQKKDDRIRESEKTGALKSLADQLSDPALKSSARILILISLSINKKLSFVELLGLTGLGKGSLQNHLEKLSSSQYVTTRNVKTFGGMRELVEITGKGQEVCRSLLTGLKNVGEKEEEGEEEGGEA